MPHGHSMDDKLVVDWVDWLGLSAAGIASFIFAPLNLYTVIRFYQLRNVDMIKNRQQKLVYLMNILTILGLFFQWAKFSRNVFEIHMNNIVTRVIYIVDGIFIWGVFALFCTKTWLLHYDKQYHEANYNQMWKSQINKQYKSWYIQNKQKWGNFDYIIKIILIPLLCCVGLESLFEALYLSQFDLHSMVILSIIWLPPTWIGYLVLKGFDDIFGIKKEIFYQIVIMVIILCVHIIQFFFQIRNIIHSIDNGLVHRMDWLFAIVISSCTLFSMSFISTAYPIYLYALTQQNPQIGRLEQSHSLSNANINKKGLSWDDMLKVIANNKGFQSFMEHLVHEFATESLLFVLELTQIKCEFMDTHSYIKDMIEMDQTPLNPRASAPLKKRNSFLPLTMSLSKGLSLTDRREDLQIETCLFMEGQRKPCGEIKLPFSLPQTELLTEHSTLREQLHALYEKYVHNDSMYTINISYPARKRLDNYFNPPEPEGMTETKKQKILTQIRKIQLFRIQSDSVFPNANTPSNINREIETDPKTVIHPNTPRLSPKIAPKVQNSTSSISPTNPKENSRSKSSLKSKIQKVASHTPALKSELSTPIIEDKFRYDIELRNITNTKSESEVSQENMDNLSDFDFSPSPLLNADDIPEDFMMILDYNMDEQQCESGTGTRLEMKESEQFLSLKLDAFDLDEKGEDTHDSKDGTEFVKVEDEFDEEKMFELLNVMDGACLEIIALMFGSYSRFRSTKKGKQLLQTLHQENES